MDYSGRKAISFLCIVIVVGRMAAILAVYCVGGGGGLVPKKTKWTQKYTILNPKQFRHF